MDKNGNIFTQGNVGDNPASIGNDKSEFGKLSGGVASASDGAKNPSGGFVNPATARATSGSESGPGTAAEQTPSSTEPKRGRGRPKGSTNARPTESSQESGVSKSVNVNGIEKVLYNIHAFCGAMIAPELALDEKEAKELANAIKGVNEQYKLTLDPKQAVWIDLMTTCGIIYGPRGLAIYLRVSSEAKPVATPKPAPEMPGNNINAPNLSQVKMNGSFDPTKQKIVN